MKKMNSAPMESREIEAATPSLYLSMTLTTRKRLAIIAMRAMSQNTQNGIVMCAHSHRTVGSY